MSTNQRFKFFIGFFLIAFQVAPYQMGAIPHPSDMEDGCRLILKAKNSGDFTIELDLKASRERIKNGKWKTLYRDGFCNGTKIVFKPKSKLEIELCEVYFGCHFERQFQFTAYLIQNGKRTKTQFYFPSPDSYLEKDIATIDLENLYRKLQK